MRLFDRIFTVDVESNRNLENVVKEEVPEESDSKIICLYSPGDPTRVICCDWQTMPTDAVEQLLESTDNPKCLLQDAKGKYIFVRSLIK